MTNQIVQKTAEIFEKNIDKATKFLGDIINPAVSELGLLFQDKVRFWRFKNQIRILNKAEEYLSKQNIKPKKIPIKTLVPLLENGSLEEDETLQDKWAALLANNLDPSFSDSIHTSYVEILKQLSPFEVKLLDKIFDESIQNNETNKESITFSKEKITQAFNIKTNQFDIIIGNLFRLNLLQPPASHGGVSIGKYPISLRTYEIISLTSLGLDFIKSCRRNS